MTIKESILKSLDEIKGFANPTEIHDYIVEKKYFEFGAKNPIAIVSANLGELVKRGDSRIRRQKIRKGSYSYILTKYEQDINASVVEKDKIEYIPEKINRKDFLEKDLHTLLSSYLKSINTFSKTIYHEQSSNSKDNHQKWIHPDMVSIQFVNLQSAINQTFLKSINRLDTFKISSYEIKKEINTDYELKKAFFQAVSNSSWANYGYLVAYEISSTLLEEMKRLNQSFGIGIMELKSNPYESRVLFTAKYKELDFFTIDKLCNINADFEKFIEQVEKLMTASDKYFKGSEKELEDFCDKYFLNDSEIEIYCKERKIPWEAN
ncbi:hypothetical protein ACM55F_14375 [Flavobacterium sp. XS2P12]|uniref:hypothetical protein n=1 Tax=Flavobacterium melibiosi TaxID=3398734 RepID=UPI003A894821